jgi:glycine cleavage system aminomethyltransferase T/glycine/D-amino acid oxidase-like deaminating enzyme
VNTLPSETKVVIVGGGIAGASVAYHLTKLGWKDVVLLEQNKLGGGTTWHAAGMVGRLRTTTSMTKINQCSAELYAGLEKETGHSVGWKQVGSIIVGKSEDRMVQLRRTCAMAELMGVEARLITADEAQQRWPLIRKDDLLGAAWLPHDGKVIPREVPLALAKAAVKRGAKVIEGVRVLNVEKSGGRVTGVATDQGNIQAEFVVLTGGMWARELGLRCGVNLPLYPVEHHYVVTDPIPGAYDELPLGRDPDLCIYFRGEGHGIMLGAFQKFTKPWLVDDIPRDFSFKLLEPDWEKYQEPLAAGKWRIPALEKCGFEKFVNGPESFTPDNNWLMGETPELRNLFVMAGFNSVGIATSGGAGKYLAEWMIEGRPTMDLWSVDVRRFGPWANNRAFLRERVTETLGLHYQMAWPNREFETARGLRKSPLHDRLAAQGACFGAKNGWERPNWFARPALLPLNAGNATLIQRKPQDSLQTVKGGSLSHRMGEGQGEGFFRTHVVDPKPRAISENSPVAPFATKPETIYSFGRQNWFPNHAAEHCAARENVAVFDQTGFSKLVLKGRDAVSVLQRLCGNDVDVPIGQAVYTGMFNERGGFESDLTVIRTAAREYFIVTGSAQTVRDFDWITRNIRSDEQAELVDVTAAFSILGVMGPNSRALLSRLTEADLSNATFPFRSAKTIAIGPATVRAVRITYVGELGWELHVPMDQVVLVYDALMAAGKDLGLINAGHYAINSLRLEKGYRAWGAELSPDDTALEAGLGFAVDWNKSFLGREALLKQKQAGVKRRLGIFVLEDPEPMLWGSEPIYRNGKPAGYTTSGAYGHTVGGAIAMGYVNHAAGVTTEFVQSGRYEINISGQRYPAKAHLRAPYDAERKKILG